jgi:hypothetical protein
MYVWSGKRSIDRAEFLGKRRTLSAFPGLGVIMAMISTVPDMSAVIDDCFLRFSKNGLSKVEKDIF